MIFFLPMNIHLCTKWVQTGPEECASICESTKMVIARKRFMLHASQAHILKALFSSDKIHQEMAKLFAFQITPSFM